MARKSEHLRVATIAGVKRPTPLSLEEAVETGDYREILLAQRREIVRTLPETKGPANAALHRQLQMISKEIQSLDAADGDRDDEDEAPQDEEFDASAV